MVSEISLTEEECKLLDGISFTDLSYNTLAVSRENAGKLASLLLRRDAIPEVRLKYFTEPEHNIGGHGKSKQDEFEKSGTLGADILYHGHFLPYLRYFVYGPDLPSDVIAEFCSSDSTEDYPALARCLVRKYHLNPRSAAEEFYKLCIECDSTSFYAKPVRDAVKSIR